MIQYVIIGINKQGVLARRPNKYCRSRKAFDMKNGGVVQGKLSGIHSKLCGLAVVKHMFMVMDNILHKSRHFQLRQ
jgi:hypothetical protein